MVTILHPQLIVLMLIVAGFFGVLLAYRLKKQSKNFDQTSHDIGMIMAASISFIGFGVLTEILWFISKYGN
jgi:multidrug transporter EmrE-like cation transporter